MAGATIDHLVSFIVFMAALLLFIGLFNQTIQTAITYQQHRYLATKCSDLLDNILLNPGSPQNWGLISETPTSFGLQDPEFTEYRLSSFSLMRLNSNIGTQVFYQTTGLYYSNTTTGFAESLLVPYNETVTSNTAETLLGINGSYEFSLSVTPTVVLSISELQHSPLGVQIKITGAGNPLAYANISYCLVETTNSVGAYPSYNITYGVGATDNQGLATLTLGTFDWANQSYALIAYAHANGLVGVGYCLHLCYTDNYAVPLVSDFDSGKVLIANSADIVGSAMPSAISYNATLVLLSEDFSLHEMPLENVTERTGKVDFNKGQYGTITIRPPNETSTDNPRILVASYMKDSNSNDSGIVLMPWGISSMAFPMTFGDDASNKEWVATDIREVTVGGIAYQVKLALWSLGGY